MASEEVKKALASVSGDQKEKTSTLKNILQVVLATQPPAFNPTFKYFLDYSTLFSLFILLIFFSFILFLLEFFRYEQPY